MRDMALRYSGADYASLLRTLRAELPAFAGPPRGHGVVPI